MHELPMVENIIRVVCEKLGEIGGDPQVTKVRVKVGRMSTAVPECLEFYFGFLKKGTPLANAVLEIEVVPVTGRCRQCGLEFELREPVFFCTSCESYDIEVTGGRELFVDSVEVED